MSYLIHKEQSDSGQPIQIYEQNGQRVALNSLYSPEKEIERFIKKMGDRQQHLFIMIGFGNGSLAEGLVKSDLYKKNIHFLFIEPFSELERSDASLALLTNNKKFSFYYAKDFDTLIFESYILKHMSIPISVQIHPNYSKIDSLAINACLKVIHEGIETVEIFKNSQSHFALDWIIEPLLNTRSLTKSSSLASYKDKFKGERAILVASGPSLQKHMAFLQENKDDFHLFSVGSALRALLVNGIQPDYTVSLDAGELNYTTHFEDLIYEGTLIFETVSHSKIQDTHKGPLIASRSVADRVSGLYTKDDVHSFSQPSPSVAVLALQVIAFFGFSEVYFVGQDLALVDGDYYATDINHHDVVKTIQEELTVENNHGQQVGTTRALKIYLEAFEALIKTLPKELSIYNLSEYGAKIAGTTFVTESAIAKKSKSKVLVSGELVKSSTDAESFIRNFVLQVEALQREVSQVRARLGQLVLSGTVSSKDSSKVFREYEEIRNRIIVEKVLLANLQYVVSGLSNRIRLVSNKLHRTNEDYLELLSEIDNFYVAIVTLSDAILKDERLIHYK